MAPALQKRSLSRITVRRKPGDSRRGWLTAGTLALPVALGRGGIKANKREGDGGTPRGAFRLLRLWWRADRHPRPVTSLPAQRISPADGWCEDPHDRRYNRPIKVTPHAQGDRLARKGFSPTAGCVALELNMLRRLLPRLGPRTKIVVE